MYRVQILQELERYDDALSLLESGVKEGRILDLTHALEYKARLLSKLDRQDEAEIHWRQLIDINPDNIDYFKGFMENRGISMGALDILRDVIQNLIVPRRLIIGGTNIWSQVPDGVH
jgi:tetratricopeptide (TPR) repeat protein